MTKSQIGKYWREWAAVKRKLGDEATDELRHELHSKALGRDMSSQQFTNKDFDLVLAEFRVLSRPADLNSQLAQMNQHRKRQLWRARNNVKMLGLYMDDPRAYARHILSQRFGVERIEDLSSQALGPYKKSPLEQFIYTIAARLDQHRSERGHSVQEMKHKSKNLPDAWVM